MEIVVLDGTHNKNGHTLDIVNNFLKGIKTNKDADIKITVYDLMKENIEFCKGCNECTKQEDKVMADCSIKDSCQKIQKHALAADILVFASPIYEYSVSSVMKRFLERCLNLATFSFGPAPKTLPIKGKIGVVICSSGAPFPFNHLMGITRHPKFILKFSCRLFGCSKIKYIFAGAPQNEKLKMKHNKRAFMLGKNISGKLRINK